MLDMMTLDSGGRVPASPGMEGGNGTGSMIGDIAYIDAKGASFLDALAQFWNTIFSAHPLCFVAGTLIQTAKDEKPIEEIQVGDMVWAWNENTGEVALKKVVETYISETTELVHIFVNGEEVISTQGHPFYLPEKGWTEAVRLRAGDILVLVNGEYVVVEKVQHEILETPVTVYNFQVEDYHTYYVASTGVLVHNTCTNPNGKKGGIEHQNKINEIGTDLENRGYTVTYEYRVGTPGGAKNTRYLDIYATKGFDSVGIQVGRMTGRGQPVSRERKALFDLINSGVNAVFVAYEQWRK